MLRDDNRRLLAERQQQQQHQQQQSQQTNREQPISIQNRESAQHNIYSVPRRLQKDAKNAGNTGANLNPPNDSNNNNGPLISPGPQDIGILGQPGVPGTGTLSQHHQLGNLHQQSFQFPHQLTAPQLDSMGGHYSEDLVESGAIDIGADQTSLNPLVIEGTQGTSTSGASSQPLQSQQKHQQPVTTSGIVGNDGLTQGAAGQELDGYREHVRKVTFLKYSSYHSSIDN